LPGVGRPLFAATAEKRYDIYRATLRTIVTSAGVAHHSIDHNSDGKVVLAVNKLEAAIANWRATLPANEAKSRFGIDTINAGRHRSPRNPLRRQKGQRDAGRNSHRVDGTGYQSRLREGRRGNILSPKRSPAVIVCTPSVE
jgi:hypothetical protein